MPESYIEPLTNRQECFKCHMTVTGKKKLSKCAGCHAITYCGKECQVADFKRHKWNCVPVMVTEIPGKGRGLVAAKDIKKGELLLKEKIAIQIRSDGINFEKHRDSVLVQLDNLPHEAKEQFHLLKVPDSINGLYEGDRLTMQKFMSNSRRTRLEGNLDLYYLLLNSALINHSCGPNVQISLHLNPLIPNDEFKTEARAIRDIYKGDEITKCYLGYDVIINSGFNRQIRMKRIKETLGFDCKCCICSGKFEDQENLVKELRDLTKSLDPHHHQKKIVDWRRELQIYQMMVELAENLTLGPVVDLKSNILGSFAAAAHLGRDEDLLRKAMDSLDKLVEDSKMRDVGLGNDRFKQDTSIWTFHLKSKKPPKKKEIDSFLVHLAF